jgi:hypothetical protein
MRTLFATVLTLSLLAAGHEACAQETLARYTASNGLVITEEDSVTIGVGSAPAGIYRHIFMSSVISPLKESYIEELRHTFALQPGQEGITVPVKKIKKANGRVYLFVPLGGSTPFIIELEDAIATCELAYCRPGGYLSQQEFEKLMLMNEAFRNGDLSEERYYELRREFTEAVPEPEHLE